MPQDPSLEKVDVRMYLGIILFRWKLIALCFLYCLLAGVIYLQWIPPKYRTYCTIMIYRDPNLHITSDSSPWSSFGAHEFLLSNEDMRKRAAKRLMPAWGERFRSLREMALPVKVMRSRKLGSTIEVNVESRVPAYAEEFLKALLEEHQIEWTAIQRTASVNAADMLQGELRRLEDKIKGAEDDLIEYLRMHDILRTDAKSTMESRYLGALMERRSQLTTEIMLLEAQYPVLKDANPSVIGYVNQLTKETGRVEALPDETESSSGDQGGAGGSAAYGMKKPALPAEFSDKEDAGKDEDNLRGWQDLRVKLSQLKQKERELAKVFEPEHQQYQSVLKAIEDTEKRLEIAAQTELGNLKDRRDALNIQLQALEQAEYKWKANNLLASQRRAELKRISDVVARFEANYNTLYSRLHDMKVAEELKAEHFHPVESVSTEEKPVWPDPLKVMMVVLAAGLGSGLGIALLIQTFDNKIQTIADVEDFLGVPFIGGVPFWVHGGLEKTVRPIVTEENSTGAVEAYRALRTSLLAAMTKLNENMMLVTSADSREGKTLTVLNLSILVAQMGKKVVLVDMDLRRGRLHRSLGSEREPGFTDVLKGDVKLHDVIRKTRIDNLSFVPAGTIFDNTAEILQGADVRGILQELKDEYDYVFIDTAPVLRVTDTVIAASQGIGAVVFVSRVNRTPKPMVKYALDMLADCRIVGLIINSIEMHRMSSLYYAYQYPNYSYYSNAYAYGYDYYYGDGKGGKGGRRIRGGTRYQKAKKSFLRWVRHTFMPGD